MHWTSSVRSVLFCFPMGAGSDGSAGTLQACDTLDGKATYDRDIVRTKYDAEGNIVGKEIVDRKQYGSASDVGMKLQIISSRNEMVRESLIVKRNNSRDIFDTLKTGKIR